MSTFEEAVEVGAEVLFLAMRRDLYRDMPWSGLPEEVREHWRKGFAAGFSVAAELVSELAPQTPQYRIRFLPNNSDGEKRIWYTGTAYGYEYRTVAEAQEAAASYRDTGHRVRIERRQVTEWTEVKL